jgi:GT2 family glycosyltransferase
MDPEGSEVTIGRAHNHPRARLLAIVLTWNSESHITDCLNALERKDDHLYDLIVVDNDSSDSTVANIHRLFPHVEVVVNGQNLGYAGGNNVGINIARSRAYEFCVLVNPDVVLRRDCLELLLAAFPNSEKLGIIGLASPLILRSGSDDWWYGGSAVKILSGESDLFLAGVERGGQPVLTDRPSGAVMMIRLDAITGYGDLDERFYLYYEETEWSVRLKRYGVQSIIVPRAEAEHDPGHGRGGSSSVYQYYMTRNRLLFAWLVGGSTFRTFAASIWSNLYIGRIRFKEGARPFWRYFDCVGKAYFDFIFRRFGRQETAFFKSHR